MSQTVIGLDIGHYSVKVLRLDVSYRGFQATGFDEEVLDTVVALPGQGAGPDEEPLDDAEFTEEELEDAVHDAEDAALVTALEALRQRGAIAPEDRVIVSMPPDLVISGRMRFPFSDPRQLAPVIPAEFEEMVPVPLDELLMDHHLVGPSALNPALNDVLVTAVKRDDLEVFLELWAGGGLDPQYVVMGDAAMLNLGAYLLEELTEPYAIVDLGHRFTRVACVEPGAEGAVRLGYSRTFQFGGHDLTQALQETFHCSYQEAERFKHNQGALTMDTAIMGVDDIRGSDALKRALRPLVRELRRTFQAHLDERRNPITRVFLCGGSSRLQNLGPHLYEELGVPFEALPVAGQELAGLQLGATAPQALALSLRDVIPPGRTVDVNFRSGPYAHKGAQGWFREKIGGLVLLGLMTLCALGAMFGSEYYAIGKEEEALKATLKVTTARLFGEELEPAAVSKKLTGGGGNASLIPKNSAYDYFFEVSKRTPEGDDIEFTDLEVDLFRQIVKIRATTTTAAVVDRYVESLELYDCFKGHVQKGGTESVGERVRFDLTIAPECPGAAPAKDKKK